MARVLFVEDEASLRGLIADALAQFGHEAVLAENGVVAVQQLDLAAFDVVITDISMPEGISGIDLALHVSERYPSSRVILVSGHARAQLPQLPDNVMFLPKPYRIRQLLELLPDT